MAQWKSDILLFTIILGTGVCCFPMHDEQQSTTADREYNRQYNRQSTTETEPWGSGADACLQTTKYDVSIAYLIDFK